MATGLRLSAIVPSGAGDRIMNPNFPFISVMFW
jgi:hypothetical protein